MAQPSQIIPTVTTHVAGSRQQVNLRDYLNQRVAPFLKKAIHESLDSEAQYPLQWLGEHLIQQSILYEGNPDSTNIKERFVYKHDMPAPVVSSGSTTAPQSATPAPSVPLEQTTSPAIVTNGAPADASTPSFDNQPSDQGDSALEEAPKQEDGSKDTEMSGTA